MFVGKRSLQTKSPSSLIMLVNSIGGRNLQDQINFSYLIMEDCWKYAYNKQDIQKEVKRMYFK